MCVKMPHPANKKKHNKFNTIPFNFRPIGPWQTDCYVSLNQSATRPRRPIMTATLHVEGFFDPDTHTVSYIVLDQATRHCALVDSVLDYDPKSGHTTTTSADTLIARVAELDAKVQWILETHVHADHLTAAPYLKEKLGGKIGIGSRITTVQQAFGTLFNTGDRKSTRLNSSH